MQLKSLTMKLLLTVGDGLIIKKFLDLQKKNICNLLLSLLKKYLVKGRWVGTPVDVVPNTRDLVMEEGGFLYDSDSYSDDLPLLGNSW